MTQAVEEQTMRMTHEKLTSITKEFKWGLAYGVAGYTHRESMQFNEDVPRKAITAESILLGIKVKHLVLEEARVCGHLEEEEHLKLLKGSVPLLKRATELLKDVVDDYLDYAEAKDSVKAIVAELTEYGIIKKKEKKAK
ncbi:hypothetical protein [Bacillus mycoides]|uniref:hypothetical protein n=1 Tax=Bacillus mycoides TaxID=1405 RepID=UPI003A80BB5D